MKTLIKTMAVSFAVTLFNSAYAIPVFDGANWVENGTLSETNFVADNTLDYSLGLTDVGKLDTLLGLGSLTKSGDGTEQDFINYVLAPDEYIIDYEKTAENTFEDANSEFVDGSEDIFTFELPFESGYYLIKNASCNNNGGCENDTALFQNNESFGWGVLSYDFLTTSMADGGLGMHFGTGDVFTISHVVSIGDIITVAEPQTLVLFSLGIVGLIGARRRQKS